MASGAGSGSFPASGRRSSTARFQAQHAELVALGKVLAAELDAEKIARDPNGARMALASFSGRLKIHAAMEQQALYPRLLASSDVEISQKARQLEVEIASIYQGFFAHLEKWSSSEVVSSNAATFCSETLRQLQRLAARMRREDDELYPLVERFDDASSGEREKTELG